MSSAIALLNDLHHMFSHPRPEGVELDAGLCLMVADALQEVRCELEDTQIECARLIAPGKVIPLPRRSGQSVSVRRTPIDLTRIAMVPFSDGHDGGAA